MFLSINSHQTWIQARDFILTISAILLRSPSKYPALLGKPHCTSVPVDRVLHWLVWGEPSSVEWLTASLYPIVRVHLQQQLTVAAAAPGQYFVVFLLSWLEVPGCWASPEALSSSIFCTLSSVCSGLLGEGGELGLVFCCLCSFSFLPAGMFRCQLGC